MEQVMERPRPQRRARRMPRALRVLSWSFGIVLALAALAVILVLVVNRRDQAPSADAKALDAIVASARPVAPADDARGGLAALGATAVETVVEVDAKARDAASMRDRSARLAARGARLDDALGACRAQRDDCAALLAVAEPDMPAWIAREAALLAQYRGVLSRRGWFEAPPPDSPMDWHVPPVGRAMQAQELLLAQAMVDARAGRADAVRDALDADAAFWRAGLAGSRTLVTKMLCARALQRNLDLGALALQRLPPRAGAGALPPAWRPPVTTAERSLQAPLAWEWKFNDNHLRRTYADVERTRRARGESSPSTVWIFKPQATSNANAAVMRRVVQVSEAPYLELRTAQRRLHADIADQNRFPLSIYNPVGRILAGIAWPAYLGYVERTADVEARRRAALAVVELHAAQVAVEGVPDALAASAWRNPYTGMPFAWDAAASCVRIGGLDRADGRGCIAYRPAPGPTPAG